MRKSSWIILFVLLFIGVWFWLASSVEPYLEEDEYLGFGKAIALTGDPLKVWNFDHAQIISVKKEDRRGIILYYLSSWAFKLPGDPLMLARGIITLLPTLLTYFILVFYDRLRRELTPGRWLIWTVLFLGSFTVLHHTLYIRYYAPLATVMTLVFILYWEGLQACLSKNPAKACGLWLVSLGFFLIPLLDMWQYQQIPMMVLGIILSLVGTGRWGRPCMDWLKGKEVWLWLGVMAMAPVMTIGLNLIPIPLNGCYVAHWFSTYWDNIVGFLRFVLTLNVTLLGLRYASDAGKPLTFSTWMFITGLLSGICCTLYNPSNQVFFPRYSYLPAVMVLIGFSGFMENAFVNALTRRWLLVIYFFINVLMSSLNFYYEHSNLRKAIQWLNTHMSSRDVLLQFNTELALNGGRQLMGRSDTLTDGADMTGVQNLETYIEAHPQGRIFYLYKDSYAPRDWLYQKTTGGGNRYPGEDIWSYLKEDIPSTHPVQGLRLCGLAEFDRTVLLKGLEQLSQKGFDQPWKSPEKRWYRRWFKK